MEVLKSFLVGLLVIIGVLAVIVHSFIIAYYIHDRYWVSGGLLFLLVEAILFIVLKGIYIIGRYTINHFGKN